MPFRTPYTSTRLSWRPPCALLLFRGYHARRTTLLFWSSLCFIGLALNSALMLIDLYVFPGVDLSFLRSAIALTGMTVLLFGLIWSIR